MQTPTAVHVGRIECACIQNSKLITAFSIHVHSCILYVHIQLKVGLYYHDAIVILQDMNIHGKGKGLIMKILI